MSRSASGGRVELIPAEEAARVVGVFVEAFEDYPVMRFVVGERGDDYGSRLHTLVSFFVAARALRGEPLLGIAQGGDLVAAATASFPGKGESPAELGILREEVWRALGTDARLRYEACGEAWRPFDIGAPHVHLNMIGVRPSAQGMGHARRLLRHVHGISLDMVDSVGVTLTTEDPGNVPIYRKAGYEVVGHARIAPDLETWGFFRPDEGREADSAPR